MKIYNQLYLPIACLLLSFICTPTLPKSTFFSIGLMSGTSMDGIDAALIETDGNVDIRELGHTSLAYTKEFHILLKSIEYAIRKNMGNKEKVQHSSLNADIIEYLSTELTLTNEEALQQLHKTACYLHNNPHAPIFFDEIVYHSTVLHGIVVKNLLKQTEYSTKQIDVVGYHGQTLFHKPSSKITVQVGNGQQLADDVGIPVINDFRSNDIQHGGQGAPFAPLYHQALAVRDQLYPLAVINCGGIANVSFISGPEYKDLLAFDTGPGNGLIDLYVKQYTSFKETMDTDGHYGLQGAIHENIFDLLYKKTIVKDGKNYFSCKPPKSLDIHDLQLITELNTLLCEDACATLEAFTADAIVQSLCVCSEHAPRFLILAGGGWNNPVIKRELINRAKFQLGSHIIVKTADEIGWNSTAMEAQIFAYLAVRSLQGKPLSVPETTNVSKPVSGGKKYVPQ